MKQRKTIIVGAMALALEIGWNSAQRLGITEKQFNTKDIIYMQ